MLTCQWAKTNMFVTPGNPALKMQHWMKNQLVKESYTEKWEDIVRSGSINSHPQTDKPSTTTRVPAEFGTKDKVPAKGTAPMGLSDYADPAQWTTRGGKVRRREPHVQSEPESQGSSGKTDSAKDGGYIGGDGASADGFIKQGFQNAADQSSSASTSQPSHQHQENGLKQAPNTAQTSGQQSDRATQQASDSGGN